MLSWVEHPLHHLSFTCMYIKEAGKLGMKQTSPAIKDVYVANSGRRKGIKPVSSNY